MDELAAIGQARGVNLGRSEVDQSIAFLESVPLDARGSMLTDIEAGRPLELEAMALLLPHKDGS